MTGAPYVAAVLADSPIMYLRLNDGTGPAASDTSGHGNAGVYNGTFYLGEGGPFDDATCLFTPASGGYVSGPTNVIGSGIPSSIEFVFKWVPGSGAYAWWYGTGATNPTSALEVSAQVTAPEVGVFNGTVDQNVFGFTQFGDSNWHHLVAVLTTGTATLFVDGRLDVQISGLAAPNALVNPFPTLCGWGTRAAASVTRTSGLWAEYALYTHALTLTEVVAHYDALVANAQSPVGTLLGGGTTAAQLQAILDQLGLIYAAVHRVFPAT